MAERQPISAAARGALRSWKAARAASYARFETALKDLAAAPNDAADFIRRSKPGRTRAFAKIRRRFSGLATLEGVRIDSDPIAVWAVINPRGPVAVEPKEPGFAQNCVTVNYLVIGEMGIDEGLWTLEVPDHAMGRLLQWAPRIDLDASVLAAHHALLRASMRGPTAAAFADRNRRFLVPAGPGVFVCSAIEGKDVSAGHTLMAYAHAHTWLHNDRLPDDQEAAAAALIVDANADEMRLGQGLLLPLPLRVLVPLGNTVQVVTWAPGLPETLAATRGSA